MFQSIQVRKSLCPPMQARDLISAQFRGIGGASVRTGMQEFLLFLLCHSRPESRDRRT
jgi:hypothetical protein